MTRSIILDVDTGSDDAIAIMLAGLASDLRLLGCTTVWGNHAVAVTTDNTLRTLDAIGRTDVPVYRGLDRPLVPIPFRFEDHVDTERGAVHPAAFPVPSTDRQCADISAVEWLVETLRATTEPVTLVPVAPLTNIATALTVDPTIVDAVDEVVIMGGAHALGNVTAVSEANIWHDPYSADVVLQARFRRLVLVGLDATHQASVTADLATSLTAHGCPVAPFVSDLLGHRISGYHETQPPKIPNSAPIHDALCVAYLIDPDVLTLTECFVEVETTGYRSFGQTLIDVAHRSRRPPNASVALAADAELFQKILLDTLSGNPVEL